MPLYEYECEKCGHRFERLQKFSDGPVQSCPTCEGQVRRLISSPAIQFKGTGWYITDYARKPSGGQAAEASADKSAKDDAKSGTKSATAGSDKKSSTESSTSSTTAKKKD